MDELPQFKTMIFLFFKISLKELRETEIWLKIIVKAKMIKPASQLVPILQETDELIAILFTSIETAKKNRDK
jgi:four helix bundle protein